MIFYMIACIAASYNTPKVLLYIYYMYFTFSLPCATIKPSKRDPAGLQKRTTTHRSTSIELMKEREVFIMKKILDKVSEFFKEYYVSFGERI